MRQSKEIELREVASHDIRNFKKVLKNKAIIIEDVKNELKQKNSCKLNVLTTSKNSKYNE